MFTQQFSKDTPYEINTSTLFMLLLLLFLCCTTFAVILSHMQPVWTHLPGCELLFSCLKAWPSASALPFLVCLFVCFPTRN